jgi:3-mercaptopyruvate sulfurtransferase SseA
VRYEQVYPGIGLVYYGTQSERSGDPVSFAERQLEYDFVVAPGADPRAISLALESADDVTVDDRDNLDVDMGQGIVVGLQRPRAGYIPGTVNLEWTRVIASGDIKTFLPASELAEVFASAQIKSSRQVVTYCQVGIRAAALYFALSLLGSERVRVYDGSWAHWSADPGLPVEK